LNYEKRDNRRARKGIGKLPLKGHRQNKGAKKIKLYFLNILYLLALLVGGLHVGNKFIIHKKCWGGGGMVE
jgi:hypothetical protein